MGLLCSSITIFCRAAWPWCYWSLTRLVNCQELPVFGFHIWKCQLCRPSLLSLNRQPGGAHGAVCLPPWEFVLLTLGLRARASVGKCGPLGRQRFCALISGGGPQVPQSLKSLLSAQVPVVFLLSPESHEHRGACFVVIKGEDLSIGHKEIESVSPAKKYFFLESALKTGIPWEFGSRSPVFRALSSHFKQ